MLDYLASIKLFAGNYAPHGCLMCDGAIFNIEEYEYLFSVIGNRFGGDGTTTFAVPDMRKVSIGKMNYIIAFQGIYPLAE